MVGGAVGSILIGVFALPSLSDGNPGLLYGGGAGLLGIETAAVVIVAVYSFAAAAAIGWLLKVTMGIRVTADDEAAGIDSTEHAEAAYGFSRNGTSAAEESEKEPVLR